MGPQYGVRATSYKNIYTHIYIYIVIYIYHFSEITISFVIYTAKYKLNKTTNNIHHTSKTNSTRILDNTKHIRSSQNT